MYETIDRRPASNTDKMFPRTDKWSHIPWEEDTLTIQWKTVVKVLWVTIVIVTLIVTYNQ